MSNVLFALTVHDRLTELRIQQTLIRHEFGKSVDIHVFCNCQIDVTHQYQGMLEDGFHWIPNNGHSQGAIDHSNMVANVVDDSYDYVVLLASKTLWTDYSLITKIVRDLRTSGKEIAVFNDDGNGHFKDHENYAFFVDVMIFSSGLYRKVFPVTFNPDPALNMFPEVLITRKVLDTIGGKNNVYYIPCIAPKNTTNNDFNFTNVCGTTHDALSSRDIKFKLSQIGSKNHRYRQIINNLLKESFTS